MNHTLFSVVVITYNSSKYVFETLESIKQQTYDHIELIISDDCSRDNTVEICKKWLAKNQNHFKSTKLVKTEKNSGIPANCNLGVNASKGEWVKIIAGDDILLNTAISDYADYINNSIDNPQIIFSRIARFEEKPEDMQEMFNNKISNYILFHPEITQTDQTRLFCRGQLIKIITMVFTRKMYDEIMGFDEDFPLREDRPFLYKLLSRGYKLYFMDKLTFLYRQHSQSIMRINKSKRKTLEIKIDNVWAPQLKYRYPNLSRLERVLSKVHYKKDKLQLMKFSGNNDFLALSIFKVLSRLTNYIERFIHFVLMTKYKSKYENSYLYSEIKNRF
jgi:alpha-1,3-rhamnosyltransferase